MLRKVTGDQSYLTVHSFTQLVDGSKKERKQTLLPLHAVDLQVVRLQICAIVVKRHLQVEPQQLQYEWKFYYF